MYTILCVAFQILHEMCNSQYNQSIYSISNKNNVLMLHIFGAVVARITLFSILIIYIMVIDS